MQHSESAPAKINLFLHVMARRPDGYHELESLIAFADVGDVLHAEAADTFSLNISGPFAAGLSADDNLVLRAARALQAELGIRNAAALHLEKNLPVASGLGGGSADAAAALRLLQRLWNTSVPRQTLEDIALRLGSDVPACLHSQSAFARGRGEMLQFVTLPELHLVLANPGVAVSTAEVYKKYSSPFTGEDKGGGALQWHELPSQPSPFTGEGIVAYLHTARNDLQPPAIMLAPQIQEALDALAAQPGCRLSRLSGSGATCFGIFADAQSAGRAAEALRGNAGWWIAKAKCQKPNVNH